MISKSYTIIALLSLVALTLARRGSVTPDNGCSSFNCPTGMECRILFGSPRCMTNDAPAILPHPGDSTVKNCGANELLNSCGDLCDSQCSDVGQPFARPCPLICGPAACVCQQGFYRNAQKQCVSAQQCSGAQTTPDAHLPQTLPANICSANEEMNACGNHCESKCGQDAFCTMDCRPPACACKSGFSRNNSGSCVPTNQC